MARIFVCGDIINMFSSRQFVGENLLNKIASSDLAIGNLEGCVYDGVGFVPKMMQHPNTLHILKQAGFGMLLLANNHITDYGKNAMVHTMTRAAEYGFKYLGAGLNYEDIYRPSFIEVDGLKLGVINMCEAHPHYYYSKTQEYGYAWIGDPGVEMRIREAASKADKVIAFIHGGLEHCTCPLSFYRNYYHWLCDCGIDIVIGGHPHIAQGVEEYENKLIFYSLGNFYFPRDPEADSSDIENHSFSVILDLNKGHVGYEVIYHKMDSLVVDLESKDVSPVKEDELSSILSPDNYRQIHSETVKKYYEGLVSNLYRSSLHLLGDKDAFMTRLKTSIKYLLLPSRMKGNTHARHKNFVHLIDNETYRFIVNEYLKEDYAREYE